MNKPINVFEEGKVLLIDKPIEWTSFDVVRKIRNLIRIKKVGHAGTLDPLATGLLIVCTGKFTKRINEFMAQVQKKRLLKNKVFNQKWAISHNAPPASIKRKSNILNVEFQLT